MDSYQIRYITSADANTTITIAGNNHLSHVTIGTTSAHALTFRNGAAAANIVGLLKASVVEGTYWFKVDCEQGLQIVIPTGYVGTASIAYRPL